MGAWGCCGEDVRDRTADLPRRLPVWMVGILGLHFLGLDLNF